MVEMNKMHGMIAISERLKEKPKYGTNLPYLPARISVHGLRLC